LKHPGDYIKRVGLVANTDKRACARVVGTAARLLAQARRQVFTDASCARMAHLHARICPDVASLSRVVDLLLVFGGDGTMLRVAREIAGCRTPMLGINIGGLGFLTAVPSDALPRALALIWQSEFKFECRALIEAYGRGQGRRIRGRALNDIVIGHGLEPRLVELEVSVDGDAVTTYRCDGLIISSPTGSTAYSLAAGGAVVFPTAPVFAITPICPHTLTNRSLIVDLASKITVKVVSSKPATILSADGQILCELAGGDVITIRRSALSVRLMHLSGSSFFEALRRKLHWRGTNV
jgi:NAD+ kinase